MTSFSPLVNLGNWQAWNDSFFLRPGGARNWRAWNSWAHFGLCFGAAAAKPQKINKMQLFLVTQSRLFFWGYFFLWLLHDKVKKIKSWRVLTQKVHFFAHKCESMVHTGPLKRSKKCGKLFSCQFMQFFACFWPQIDKKCKIWKMI